MGAYFTKINTNYYMRLTGSTTQVKFACVSNAGNIYNLLIDGVIRVQKISNNGATFYTASANPKPPSGTENISIFSGAETTFSYPGSGTRDYLLSVQSSPTPGTTFYLGGESLNWGTGLYAYPGSGSSVQAKGIGIKTNVVGVGATWKNSQSLWIKRYVPYVSSITYNPLTTAEKNSLTISTYPNDDGFWSLNLPWNVNYMNDQYDTIYVQTNSYVSFGGGSSIWSNFSPSNPPLDKIFITTRDNSCQKLYYGTLGTSPNRRYAIRFEGSTNIVFPPNTAPSGTKITWEMILYENSPGRIDINHVDNDAATSGIGTNGVYDRYNLSRNLPTISASTSARIDSVEEWSECESAYLKTSNGWEKIYQNNTNSSWINMLELTDDAIDFAVQVIALN